MDQGAIHFDEFHECLRHLETINHLTLAYRPTLGWLKRWLKTDEPFVVLDAGSGSGDMLRQLDKKFSRFAKNSRQFVGVDLNPQAKKSAQLETTSAYIRYETADIFSFDYDRPIDFIISSLFTHHLTDEQIVIFLRWMNQKAKRGWFINDLHRHPIPYYFIKVTTRLLSKNRLIRNDAAVSVARAFTKADWYRLLRAAGVEGKVQVTWHFPFRICVSCEKNNAAGV